MPSVTHNSDSMSDRAGIIGRIIPAIALAGMMGVSLAGKLINRFAFFIYPDSYYYLMIAENLRQHFHPVGTLGPGGQPFPPSGYAAMKTTFPVLVAIATMLGLGSEEAGFTVSMLAAVATVPMAYVAVKRLLDSTAAGLVAGALVATSYGLTYWSGFVMTDSVSVFLGFAVLAMVAKRRTDDWSNLGDLGTGAVFVLLMLSRPTYVVAVPALLWIGVRGFGWTRKRVITAVVSTLLLVSFVAMLWFPPAEFGARLVANLAPVLAGAFAVGAGALLLWRVRSVPSWLGGHERTLAALTIGLASLVPLAFLLERGVVLLGHESPFVGLYRFVLRDPATVLALIPGAVALLARGKRDVAAPLLITTVILLGVYFWVEPRESRYLVHLLPFMVPVSAAAALLRPGDDARPTSAARRMPGAAKDASGPIHRQALRAFLALTVVLSAGGLGYQGWRSLTRASASFLTTDYPREVAKLVAPEIEEGDVLISALPWPYYFRLRLTTWGAGVVFLDDFADYVEPDATVLVLEDASLRFHYGGLADDVVRLADDRIVAEFQVPTEYQYGYAAVADPKPVRLYRMTAAELAAIAEISSREATSYVDPE